MYVCILIVIGKIQYKKLIINIYNNYSYNDIIHLKTKNKL